jgi:hypothetical protein
MTPILLLIVKYTRRAARHSTAAAHPRRTRARHARTGAGLLQNYTLQQITLCHNTPQTFEHRAFPRFGRDIGPGLDLAFSEPHSRCRSSRGGAATNPHSFLGWLPVVAAGLLR